MPGAFAFSSEDFACAFAAAGALSIVDEHDSAESIAESLVSLVTPTGLLNWWIGGRNPKRDLLPAEVLRDAWKLFLARHVGPFRLEAWFYLRDFDPFWIVSELSRAEVGAASVFIGQSRDRPRGPAGIGLCVWLFCLARHRNVSPDYSR